MQPGQDNAGIDVIPYHECLELLKTEEVGRIAVVVEGRPEIFPVNYVLDGNGIMFRTDRGTKLVGASHGPEFLTEVKALSKISFEHLFPGPGRGSVGGMPVDGVTSVDRSRSVPGAGLG